MGHKTIAEILDNEKLIVLDLETTGLDKSTDEILQIGLMFVDKGKIKAKLSYLINPGLTDDEWDKAEACVKIHGITREFVKQYGISLKDALAEIEKYCAVLGEPAWRGCKIVTQNGTTFDIPFLQETIVRKMGISYYSGYKYLSAYLRLCDKFPQSVDTKFLGYNIKDLTDKSLKGLCEYFGIVNKKAHDGLADCEATFEVLQKMKDHPDTKDINCCFKISDYLVLGNEGWSDKLCSMPKYYGMPLHKLVTWDSSYFIKYIMPLLKINSVVDIVTKHSN